MDENEALEHAIADPASATAAAAGDQAAGDARDRLEEERARRVVCVCV